MSEILRSQKSLFLKIESCFGDDVVLRSLSGFESVSGLFEFRLNLTSQKVDLGLSKALLSDVHISIETGQNAKRFINGIITAISQSESQKPDKIETTEYNVTLKPKLWLLTTNKNCAIFQKKTPLEIVKQILSKHKIQFKDETKKCGKKKLEYCIQYNETDYEFISRLLAQEGVFFLFEQKGKNHTLILADSTSSYVKDNNNTVSYSKAVVGSCPPYNMLLSCDYSENVVSKTFESSDYNFETPKTDLYQKAQGKGEYGQLYQYPGLFSKTAEGEHFTNIRMDFIQSASKILKCKSTCVYLGAGYKFEVEKHPRKNINKNYTAIRIDHHLDTKRENGHYYNFIHAIPSDIVFRPAPINNSTNIPNIFKGIVVGPKGEEIYCDKYRRIKAQLFFDRENKKNENSSCWFRVVQPIAGKSWGTTFTPRIGSEVILSYTDNDVNNMVVIGCLYNADNPPPYNDKEPTKTTLKTISSKGGNGFNEMCFDDKKDEEKIIFHAEKDMTLTINNSRDTLIKEKNDTTTLEKGSKTTHLKGEGEGDGNYQINIDKGNLEITIKKGDAISKLQNGNYKQDINGDLTIKVKGKINIKADGDLDLEGKNVNIKSLQAMKLSSGTDLKIKSGTDLSISSSLGADIGAKTSMNIHAMVEFEVSGASISIKADGNASFQAPMTSIGGGIVNIG